MDIRVNFERLKGDIESLAQIGRDLKGGITRPSYSKADLIAQEWLKEKIEAAGLLLRQDGAGNIFARLEGKGKTIMVGSHIDTVINGGMFDGAVGVLSGLECLRRIKEENLNLSKPLELASFVDEEGNLVGDFLGSRAFIGLLERETLEKGMTQFGIPFTDVLKGTQFTIDSIMEAHKQRLEIESFLEIHIEQGPTLEMENKPIGIVDSIAGKHYRWCAFLGKASHSGTTPLELRHDAFLGLADFALRSTQHVATKHYGSMVTIGKINVHPGAFSVVPGQVDFSFEYRSTSKETLEELEKSLLALAEDIASTRGLEFKSTVVDKTEPVKMSPRIIEMMKEECQKLGYPFLMIPSGAGHDAQIIAREAEVGMIFIPCVDGISHSPEEMINWKDLEKGANLLLAVLLKLAG
ncbi:MAG: hydantoinase/carbamoylase family amidase [Candidatus Aminicenantes bacterium]|nr:hydantoinase/carbamoylase family amidase [Candidatus Aminicenantes bacterium]